MLNKMNTKYFWHVLILVIIMLVAKISTAQSMHYECGIIIIILGYKHINVLYHIRQLLITYMDYCQQLLNSFH